MSNILASKMAGTLYIGVTSDLVRRISEHHAGIGSHFTLKNGVHRLVYYQEFGSIEADTQGETPLEQIAIRLTASSQQPFA